MAKNKKEGPTQKERDDASELAGKIVNRRALNLALTHSLTMNGAYGPQGGQMVAGNLYARDVQTPEGAIYAGKAAGNSAGMAYAQGRNVMGSSFSNADVALMAFNGIVGSQQYTQLKVGQMAELYGVKDVDPKLAKLQYDQLDPENDAHKPIIGMYESFLQSMQTRAINEASGIEVERENKSIEDVVKPKAKK